MKRKKSILLAVFGLTSNLLFMMGGQTTQAVPNGGYARPEILIQPEELKALIEKKDPGIRIIDIREKVKYLAGHVPGAVHVWRPDIVDKNHRLPGMMAPQTQIEEFLGSIGISDRNTIVIYSDGPDNGRLWWILAYYGFPLHQMKLLDGGIDGWKTKGYPTETSEPRVEKVRFKFQERGKEREPLLCNLREVKEALKNPKKVVLDVRSKKEYLGEETLPGAVKPGRIPGVAYIEWKEVLVKKGPYKGYWKSSDEIKKLFFDIKVTPDKDVHIY
ncbi:MAG: hypothetical protein COZ69_02690 [Deltaproteobacteria bacterium CG_4_8_14_3_um_filter_45_9]|nr:MAG: hypothetical protein COZ69_02690 [Deltaproteobacteria bacterium CG_4_8_14_3_um_filter_45_9]